MSHDQSYARWLLACTPFQGENMNDWSGMAAASTIALLPIVIIFLSLRRYFVEGVAGAARG